MPNELVLQPSSMVLKDGAFTADWEGMEKAARAYAAQFDGIEIYDEESRKQAAKIRADINAKKRELNQARIALSKRYDEPKNEFKAKVDAILAILDEQIRYIDGQLKEKDRLFHQARMNLLRREYEAVASSLMEVIPLDVFLSREPRLIGRTWSGSKACDVLSEMIEKAATSRASLAEHELEFPMDADRVFCETLDLVAALNEDVRLVKQRKEREARTTVMPQNFEPKSEPKPPEKPAERPATSTPAPAASRWNHTVSKWDFPFEGTRDQALQIASYAKTVGVRSPGIRKVG